MYAKYWQKKLDSNKDVYFPDTLVDDVAESTEGFSFAFLKEALYVSCVNLTFPTANIMPSASVSTLVTLAGIAKDKPSFSTTLKLQIKALRKQLEKTATITSFAPGEPQFRSLPPPPNDSANGSRDVHDLLDALSDSIAKSSSLFETSNPNSHLSQIRSRHSISDGNRDVRVLLDALSDAIDKNRFSPSRIFDTRGQSYPQQISDSRDFRTLLDGLSNNRNDGTLPKRLFSGHPDPKPIPSTGQDWMSHRARDDPDRLNPFLPDASATEERRAANKTQFEWFNSPALSLSGSKGPSSDGHQAPPF